MTLHTRLRPLRFDTCSCKNVYSSRGDFLGWAAPAHGKCSSVPGSRGAPWGDLDVARSRSSAANPLLHLGNVRFAAGVRCW
jgi:hypothetical protein